ncbi:peptidyl-prolyl cis-trans isomerase [Parasphingorhabdus halotolerans]|uniref:Parvulin-like PPIase n=1 Tax=Parasphingorhabdus halotolerans TaxID=2725558 RepID=A0A6H2DPT8_9SPHN|nr:peptidylprolyl isomerase [Parasphingorhabdus halotolerans]QJB69771.1 peptidyl-prolyl cis-trans isomerase [Parasphingorhabdus halotolerans]
MRKLLKEPLIHFLGGALLVFGFFWATGTNRDPADYAITIADADIQRLKTGWEQNFRRPPTNEELEGLINQEITEEIYYREALRLGLDQGDPVIRRRLFTKMRFLNNEDAANEEPSDADLQKWMDINPEQYVLSSLYNLEQIYLGQGDSGNADRVNQIVEQLNKGTVKPADVARPISLPATLSKASMSDISRQFGEQFADGLEALKPGLWRGPVPSGFGLHLVKITSKTPGKAAALDEVRQQVTNDWRAAQTAASETKALDRYKAQYDIEVAGRK